MNTDILTVLDFIGVISFTISGALVAARKDMDYLGVCILGIVTAVGGGATRDLIIGFTPPVMFRNPVYVAVAFAVANIVFFFLYFHLNGKSKPKMNHIFGNTLFWFDTIGLASFTVDGVIVGQTMTDGGLFLCAFLGVITGVGGGVLRDLLANEVPAIFKLLQKWGNVDWKEMYRTFNMGIGMVLIVSREDAEAIKADLKAKNEPVYEIGHVTTGNHEVITKGGVFNE